MKRRRPRKRATQQLSRSSGLVQEVVLPAKQRPVAVSPGRATRPQRRGVAMLNGATRQRAKCPIHGAARASPRPDAWRHGLPPSAATAPPFPLNAAFPFVGDALAQQAFLRRTGGHSWRPTTQTSAGSLRTTAGPAAHTPCGCLSREPLRDAQPGQRRRRQGPKGAIRTPLRTRVRWELS